MFPLLYFLLLTEIILQNIFSIPTDSGKEAGMQAIKLSFKAQGVLNFQVFD
jgi:hypothetical protein